ncbi:hypothetical protein H6Y62_09175 [Staphylococcus lugdunensis]|uniref:hypothetical protein n=1 Tax=Staphylococcus TaxID=1279 RepID=UPI001932CC93|nr:hypothetical protein [Staphylococcus lugdunensis]MBT2769154.1 hypothetical protein [Staphylococcus warneri]QRF15893.1 hypothetical protein H6Y62_09175 [Staphylococcus lugdunensis]
MNKLMILLDQYDIPFEYHIHSNEENTIEVGNCIIKEEREGVYFVLTKTFGVATMNVNAIVDFVYGYMHLMESHDEYTNGGYKNERFER